MKKGMKVFGKLAKSLIIYLQVFGKRFYFCYKIYLVSYIFERQKVVHGTADSLNCFFHGGKSRTVNQQKFSKCDLFLQHCDHSTTVELVKHHLRMNIIIDTTGIRVDVASKEIAEFRSFRMLAPKDLRQTLLQPDLSPEGVRVKDYVIYTKPNKTVSKSKYRGRQY